MRLDDIDHAAINLAHRLPPPQVHAGRRDHLVVAQFPGDQQLDPGARDRLDTPVGALDLPFQGARLTPRIGRGVLGRIQARGDIGAAGLRSQFSRTASSTSARR